MKHPPVTPAWKRLRSSGMEAVRCIGACVPLFLIAVVFDVVGVVLLFVGIFANLRLDGRFYGDFLIYTGSLIIFFSLGCWLMWYVGNLQVSEDLGPRRNSSIVQLARKISERLSQRLRGDEHKKFTGEEEEEGKEGKVGKASRVTWGKSTAYQNEGYDDSLDSPGVEKKEELEKEEQLEI